MLRRLVMISAGAGLVLSVLAWGASIKTVTWRNPRTLTGVFGLWSGMLIVSNGGSYSAPGWDVGSTQWTMHWWPQESRFFDGFQGARWRVIVPLWMPTLAFGGAFLGTVRWRRERRPGFCEVCGYDLRGSADGCPECGRGRGEAGSVGEKT